MWESQSGKLLAVLQGHASHIHCLAVSHDGSLVATGSCDCTVRIWDVENEKARVVINCPFQVMGVDLSPDEKSVLVGTIGHNIIGEDPDNLVKLYNIDGTERWSLHMPAGVFYTHFSGDGSRFAAVIHWGACANLYIFQTETRKQLSVIGFDAAGYQSTQKPAMSADLSECLLPWGSEVVMVDSASGHPQARFLGGHPLTNAVALSPDGKFAACAGGGLGDPYGRTKYLAEEDHTVKLVNLSAATAAAAAPGARRLVIDTSPATALAMEASTRSIWFDTTPDARAMVTGERTGNDYFLNVFDLVHGAKLFSLTPSNPTQYKRPLISPDGRCIAVVEFGRVRLMAAAGGAPLYEFHPPAGGLFAAGLFSPDGSLLYLYGDRMKQAGTTRHFEAFDVKSGKSVREWEVRTSDDPAAISIDGQWIAGAISADGQWIAGVNGHPFGKDLTGQSIEIWNAKDGALVKEISLQGVIGPAIHRLFFLPGGVICAVVRHIAYRWNIESGEQLPSLDRHRTHIEMVLPSPDGSKILTAATFGTAMLWDAASGNLLHTYRYPMGERLPQNMTAAWPADGNPSVLILRADGPDLITLED